MYIHMQCTLFNSGELLFKSGGCFCRCHRLFFSLSLSAISLPMIHCKCERFFRFCCCCYCVDLSITSHQVLYFYLAPALEKYFETSTTLQRKGKQKKKKNEEKKREMPKCKEQKKHMLYVLSTKALCINVNICEDFS